MSDTSKAYLGRQPILENGDTIIGYEFFFRSREDSVTADFDDDLNACAMVMMNIMAEMGTEWLLADKLAFINVSKRAINSDLIQLFPPQKAVLELVDGIDEDDLPRLRDLKSLGYSIAVSLEDALKHPSKTYYEIVNYVKCDSRSFNEETGKIVESMQLGGISCIADKVETIEQKSLAESYGFTYFQGFYFAKPVTFATKTIQTSNSIIMELLSKVSRGEDMKLIEEGFKRDVTLSFKLLKYINSAGFGMRFEIESVRHALSVLGYQQLYRWLTLLLVTSGNGQMNAASKTAITRGRLCELLGAHVLSGREKENLFIVGVFSLMDILVGMPLEDVVTYASIPDDVKDSILGEGGVYEPFLQITKACESNDVGKITELADLMNMSPEFINKSHLEALAWSESLI